MQPTPVVSRTDETDNRMQTLKNWLEWKCKTKMYISWFRQYIIYIYITMIITVSFYKIMTFSIRVWDDSNKGVWVKSKNNYIV